MFGSQFEGKVHHHPSWRGAVVTVAGAWDSKLHGIATFTVRKQRAANALLSIVF